LAICYEVKPKRKGCLKSGQQISFIWAAKLLLWAATPLFFWAAKIIFFWAAKLFIWAANFTGVGSNFC
jgi:hypothetical protein